MILMIFTTLQSAALHFVCPLYLDDLLDQNILLSELMSVIVDSPNNRAPRPDTVPFEFLKK